MEITRGAIVLASGPGEYTSKPRPFLIVQSDVFNPSHGSFSLCPIISHVGAEGLFRVLLEPSEQTGLIDDSEVQVDKVQTLRRNRIVRILGRAPATTMEQADQALRRWLAL
ncbi:type II toxin-antitoxin system PemK/MazF family toxin [Sphingomonas sp. RS2018]